MWAKKAVLQHVPSKARATLPASPAQLSLLLKGRRANLGKIAAILAQVRILAVERHGAFGKFCAILARLKILVMERLGELGNLVRWACANVLRILAAPWSPESFLHSMKTDGRGMVTKTGASRCGPPLASEIDLPGAC